MKINTSLYSIDFHTRALALCLLANTVFNKCSLSVLATKYAIVFGESRISALLSDVKKKQINNEVTFLGRVPYLA